jgi:hypothetical protein
VGTFKLSLPTDIPWRRLCVSPDMVDPLACDASRPPRWSSSIAVFHFQPAEDDQPFEDELVSYIKVVVTIAPFAPDIDVDSAGPVVPEGILDDIEDVFPCFGAVLQVTVAPHQLDGLEPAALPYFIDFEPKRRELFEAVTDTGEVLTGSSSSLTVGKAVTDTHSTERYDLEMGGGGGFSLGWGAVSANWSDQYQEGTVKRSTHDVSTVRTSDLSSERRELMSHTTQLTQMYNLFQAFHLGTNRAVFLMEPRPHIRDIEETFIGGPRALEGIQEVFLAVVRPKKSKDLCVGASLETAHVTYEPVLQAKTKALHRTFKLEPMNSLQTFEVAAPAGWHFDTAAPVKASTTVDGADVDVDVQSTKLVVTFDGMIFMGSKHTVSVSAHLESDEPVEVDQARSLFLAARDVCCCPQEPQEGGATEWISAEFDVSDLKWRPDEIGPTSSRISESRRLAARLRHDIVRSFSSSRRYDRATKTFAQSLALQRRVADLVRIRGLGLRELSATELITDKLTRKAQRALGRASAVEILAEDPRRLARRLGVDIAHAESIKASIQRGLAER